MHPGLRALLEPHLQPVVPGAGHSLEAAVHSEALSLAYVARTFLDWDGPMGEEEVLDIEQALIARTM